MEKLSIQNVNLIESMHNSLWAIANMQIGPETSQGEVLALCMSIARIELEKVKRWLENKEA